ncbi:FecR family protein [Algoriphagus boseongensis]|uniref:FecR family protein n=1 Tax=Algoriphagus boseongensis TaxID=1442587 RepID=A0A4R6T8W8_9BACT|nr:FecR domain-containing protein [Algoriphagus boseongensis]TDQ18272.1 FecR family protein [Algoriphagus boseongensis]
MSEQEYIEDLVVKFLLGEANPEEIKEVETWCAQSSANQKYLEDTKLIIEKSQLPSSAEFDPEKAWSKVGPKLRDTRKEVRSIISLWKIAASLILVAVVAYLFYWYMAPGEEFVYLSENEVLTQTLPDQTEISLNRESEIKVDYNPRKKTGTIQLKGEATISIGKEKDIQWIVEAENLLIKDIGTVFNVKAYPEDQMIEVSVLEGAVQFYEKGEEGILLKAGEMGVYDKISKQYSKTQADTNVVSFKTRSFQFTEENLQEVVDLISEVYDQEIILSGPVGSCKVTVGFENEDMDTILEILSETMGLEIRKVGNQIILQGEGCF